MSAYGQNAGNISPRNGIGDGRSRNSYPRGVPVYGPGGLPPSAENPGSTLPSDGFSARPSFVNVDVSFGDHDALGGRLMEVAQADTFDGSQNPFPACGVYDQPNAWHGIISLIRLQPSTSAHPGAQMPAGSGGPNMVFQAPPSFSAQSRPIYAVGL